MVQISFKRDLPAMNAIKKKITWYKYANINKVIRKPPIMKNMPFEKLFSVHLVGETDAGKRACVSVTSLPAPKKRAPHQHHFILCRIHISSVLKSNTKSPSFRP